MAGAGTLLGEAFTLVALNFTDHEQRVPFAFPVSGDYSDALDGADPLSGVVAGVERTLAIPSNHGRVWTTGSAISPGHSC